MTNGNPNIPQTPKTLSVPEAGRQYFNLGKNASYEAARRGQLPAIRIGRRLRVSISALDKILENAGNSKYEH
jgi:excisionase family DNA binding protein